MTICASCGYEGPGWHCSGCHETFGGVVAFDLHRRGSYDPAAPAGHGRRCIHPAMVGLVHSAQGWGQASSYATPTSTAAPSA